MPLFAVTTETLTLPRAWPRAAPITQTWRAFSRPLDRSSVNKGRHRGGWAVRYFSPAEIRDLYIGEFATYRSQSEIAEWRRRYLDHLHIVHNADREVWLKPSFQQSLWESDAISSIGPGQSVTVTGAYDDSELASLLFDARERGLPISIEERGAALQSLYDMVLERVYPRYTPRRPRARIVRILAALFPEAMTCLMDARRVNAVQRALIGRRLPGGFVAQHADIRALIAQANDQPPASDLNVDQSIFAWFLWETHIDTPDEGAVTLDAPIRKASALPPIHLLSPAAQRRSLTCVSDNIALLQAMVREAEQGISREDLVSVIVTEATQLNASSAANIISQAMGGLGLLRLEGAAYRPTDRGHEFLTADEPAQALRGPLVGRVFGMGHLLLMLQRSPNAINGAEAAKRIRDLVPTWTTNLPGSHIVSWARLTGLVVANAKTGLLSLTEEGEDYAAALPEHFETRWRIAPDNVEAADQEATAQTPEANVGVQQYGIAEIVADGSFLDEARLGHVLDLLRQRMNLILQGPPGTGKTWLAKRLGYALIGTRDLDRLMSVQFQPTLSYEDFVRGWRPDGQGGLQLADGAFLDAINAASEQPDRPFVVVIEEINRGNPAQILGELLTLIEASKRDASEALRLAYPRNVDERIHVPRNLYIIGTMNLADRSLALVDLALRRRFAFVDLSPELGAAWHAWCRKLGAPEALTVTIAKRIQTLNRTISEHRALGPQFCIGHSFVTPVTEPGPQPAQWAHWFNAAIEHEIGPLLREYWYDDAATVDAQLEKLRQPL